MITLRHAIKIVASRAAIYRTLYRTLTDRGEMAAWHLGLVEVLMLGKAPE